MNPMAPQIPISLCASLYMVFEMPSFFTVCSQVKNSPNTWIWKHHLSNILKLLQGEAGPSTAALQLKHYVSHFVYLYSCILSPVVRSSRECTYLQPILLSLTSPLQGNRLINSYWVNKVTVETHTHIYMYIYVLFYYVKFFESMARRDSFNI